MLLSEAFALISEKHNFQVTIDSRPIGGSSKEKITARNAIYVHNGHIPGSRDTETANPKLTSISRIFLGENSYKFNRYGSFLKNIPRSFTGSAYGSGNKYFYYKNRNIWFPFDLNLLETPGEFFLHVYEAIFGILENSSILREDLPTTFPSSLLDEVSFYYRNTLGTEFRTLSNSGVSNVPFFQDNSALPSYGGKGVTWDQRHPESIPKESTFDFTFLEEQTKELRKKEWEECEKRVKKLEDIITSMINDLRFQEKELQKEQAFLSKLSIENKEELNDVAVNGMKGILSTYYQGITQKDNTILAVTKPILCVEEGVMKADIGSFLVKITSNSISYTRLDGLYVLKSSYTKVIAPHSMESNICWGNYSSWKNDSLNKRNYQDLLLMTYNHLSQVTTGDCYCGLREYVTSLGIKHYIDLQTGANTFPDGVVKVTEVSGVSFEEPTEESTPSSDEKSTTIEKVEFSVSLDDYQTQLLNNFYLENN